VYQRYLGWFDGNPANLHPLPPKEAGARYVEFMGGAGDLLRKARACFERGEYRFVAQVVNHLVFADPDNAEARQLQADALEQLGYQAESGSWRGFYLTAAQELRHGAPRMPGVVSSFSPDVVRAMSPAMLLDYMAVRLDGPAAEDRHIQFDLEVSDRGERFAVRLENSVLSYVSGRFHPLPDFRVRLDHAALVSLALSEKSLDEQLEGGEIVVEGRGEVLRELVPLLDRFQMWFDIVTP
jgi:alkyl sulfatase BDS1-like metallo-beta-lactamase superfamily hydrolase